MQKQVNMQDVFLNQARRERSMLTIFLVNGFQFKGTVKAFDNYVMVLEVEGRQRLVYKHAISTIVPEKEIDIFVGDGNEE